MTAAAAHEIFPDAPAPSRALCVLWQRMAEIYGTGWTAAYGTTADNAIVTWAKGLADVKPDQLAVGLAASTVAADPNPPTLPEFRARCFAIPSLARVKLELRSAHKRSPFTHLVWQYVDSTAYAAAANQEKSDRMLRDAYDVAREHVILAGDTPSMPAGSGTHEKQQWKAPPPEERAEILRRARAQAGEGAPVRGKDAASGSRA